MDPHETYLRAYASDIGYSFEDLMAGARAHLEFYNGMDDVHKRVDFEMPDTEEFWSHYEAYMGKRVAPDDRFGFIYGPCCVYDEEDDSDEDQ